MPSFFTTLRNLTSKKPKSILKKKNRSIFNKFKTRKTKKSIKINSPKNSIKEYSLNSEEKRSKQHPRSNLVKCSGYNGVFPCVKHNTIFRNRREWVEYVKLSASDGKNVGRSREIVMSELSKKGKTAKNIPKEYRLYNIQTGEVFDLRDFSPSKL
jgi:hypothetical protein